MRQRSGSGRERVRPALGAVALACAVAMACSAALVAAAGPYYLTGTVRDRPRTGFSDFGAAVTSGNADFGGTSWYTTSTTVLGDPVASGTNTANIQNFANWWADDNLAAIAPFTIKLTENGAKPNFFQFSADPFYPIDNQLLGNQGDPNNRYFTYELHSMFTYTGNPATDGMEFNTRDDLYVFLNGKFCPLSTSLTGLHDKLGSAATLSPASCGASMTAGNQYRVDIFYASRSSVNAPYLYLQLPTLQQCNAATTNIIDGTLFPYVAANTIVSGITQITSTTAIRLSASGQLNFNGAVYNSIKKRISNGFVSSFTFQVTPTNGNPLTTPVAEGFAFVLQSTSTSSRGSGGKFLGYNFPMSLAIEFDMSNSGTGDSNSNHIELHTAYDQAVDNAPDNYVITSTAPALSAAPAITMADGAAHNVIVQYAPCLPVCQTPSQLPCGTCAQPAGYVSVWIDGNLRLYSKVNDDKIKSMMSSGAGLAYVGFTVGTSSIAANIDITNWRFYNTPVSALLSVPVETVSPFGSGTCTGGCSAVASNAMLPSPFYVRAADACGTPIPVGGDTVAVNWPAGALTTTGLTGVSDLGNGRYAVQYAQQTSGSIPFTVVLNSQPIAASPLTMTISPAVVNAGTSSWPMTFPTLTAGAAVPLAVTAKDQFGNAVTTPAAPLVVQITSGSNSQTMPAPSVAGNTFTFQVSYNYAGSAQLYVRANNIELAGSPYTVNVVAAAAQGAGSFLSNLGGQTLAGNAANIVLYPCDAYGNAVQVSTGQTITFTMTLATNGAITGTTSVKFVAQSGQQNAYWNLTKTATVAGSYSISVKLNGVEVQGSTLNSNPAFYDSILPAYASATTTTATLLQTSGGPSNVAYAGKTNYFYVNTFDQYSNALISPNNGFTVTITPPTGSPQTANCDTGAVINASPFASFSCAYDTTSAGRYVVYFQCQVASASTYSYTTRLNGVALTQAAQTFTCKPGDADASKTQVTATPAGTAGATTTFTVTVKDAFGNVRSTGDPATFPDLPKLGVSVTSPSGAAIALGTLVSNGDGTFTQSYVATQAGTNQLRVVLNTAAIFDGNAVPQTINPGGTYALATVFSGAGYQNGQLTGASVSFTLVAFDRYGNRRNQNGDTFRTTLAANDGTTVQVLSDSTPTGTDGTYTIGYTVPTYSAALTAYNLTTVLVTAGNAFAGRVTLQISSGSQMWARFNTGQDPRSYTVSSGVPTALTITRQDVFGTLTPNDATTFSFDFSTGGPSPGDVTSCVLPPSTEAFVSPRSPGSADIAFKCKKTGTYLLNLRGNGEFVNTSSPGQPRIGKAPFILTVSPGVAQDVVVTGLTATALAGNAVSITIQLVDAYGNNLVTTPGGLQLKFTDQLNNQVTSPTAGTDITCPAPTAGSNGQYTVTFSSKTKGLKTISFLLGGVPLAGQVPTSGSPVSPTRTIQILPQTPDQTKTQLNFKLVDSTDPANIPSAIAGQPTDMFLSIFDQYNNAILEYSPGVPLTFAVQLQDNSGPAVTVSWSLTGQYFTLRVTPTIVKVTDSATLPTFVITTGAGQGSTPLWSKTMFIAPASIAASTTTVSGIPTAILPPPISQRNAIAGQAISFSFLAKDQYGNGLPNNSPTLTFRCKVNARSLDDPSTPFTELTLNPPTVVGAASVTQATQGVFTFTFTPTRTGSYYFKFYAIQIVGGVPQQPVEVVPSAGVSDVAVVAAAAKSLSPPLFLTTTQWAAGIPQKYKLRTVDTFGNALSYPGTSVALQFLQYPVSCSAADVDVTSSFAPASTAVLDNGDGTFNITILTTISGSFAMKLAINGGQYLPCSAPAGQDTISNRFAFITTPGPFDAAHSRIFAIVPSGRAGSTFTLRIASSDRFDNAVVINPPNPIVKLEPYRGSCAGSAQSWLASPTTVSNVQLTVTPRAGLASFLDVSFTPSKAGTAMYFNVTINGTQVGTAVTPNAALSPPLLGQLCPSLPVASADTAAITAPAETTVVAAIPTSYVAKGFDQFSNPVLRNDHVFLATYRSVNISYQFTVQSTAVSPGVTEDQLIAYTPVWAGDYTTEIVVSDSRGVSGILLKRAMTVLAATCGGQTNDALPYRCPGTDICVATYADCDPFTPSAPNVCPNGTVACPDFNYCVSNAVYCPKRQLDLCPAGMSYRCSGSGDCRASAADCPTDPVCPPGYSFCPDNRQCAIDMSDCLLPATGSCPANQYKCQDGDCALRKEDCPTRKTCPAGQVLCTDGSCQVDVNHCYDQYLCYGDTPLRCPDGSCRSDLRDCPKAVTCPVGWVHCENGACAPTLAQCTAAAKCSASQTRCPDGSCRPNLLLCPTPVSCPQSAVGSPALVRCHDGSCVANIWQCSAPVLCTGAKPYTCADSSCVSDPKYCATAIRCPDVSPILCPDKKSCAASQAECMKSPYCLQVTPLTPYMCETGRCVATPDACGRDLMCPSSRPVRCSEGTCVVNADECPSGLSSCPDTLPLRCPDGSCAAASDQCSDSTLLSCPVQTLPNAPFAFVRCPSGNCAPNRGSCPTPLSCGPSLNRCRDGTCRSSCDQVTPNQCVGGLVSCPVSQHGPTCAATLADCPSTITCPRDRPIKCVDASCAATFADCPAVASYSANKVACAGGTWAPTLATCGTQVTCPKSLPAKCWDESCRLTAADCPPRPKCPSTAPFACSDGSCYATLSDCRASVQCNPAQSQAFRGTVKCPYYDSNLGSSSAGCVKSAADCEKYNPLTFAYTKSQSPDQNLGTQVRCPNLAKRCRDGSCRSDSTQCSLLTCPAHVPYRCPDGFCARNSGECRNALNSCPFDAPTKCADGSCARDADACKAYEATLILGQTACANGSVVCPDGSCVRSLTSCPLATGCTTGYEACSDRNCVQIPTGAGVNSLCVDSSGSSGNNDAYNQCPLSRPYQCPDGYCALSSRFCPIYPADDTTCSVTVAPNGQTIVKPYRCADGTCVMNLAQCSALAPCRDPSTRRCLDGSCRIGSSSDTARTQSDSCPKVNTCPSSRPYRCEHSGLCAVNLASCVDDPLEFAALRNTKSLNATQALSVFGGCPQGRVRCPGGYCASGTLGCAADPAPTKWVSQAWNGCPAGSYGALNGKCPNGECSPAGGVCKLPNGCDPSTPFLCGNGQCSATVCNIAVTGCSGAASVQCADGTCAADASQCKSKWQCPLATPYRCADGTCKRYPAIVNEHRLTFDPSLQCKAVVVCENPNPYLCADGSCATEQANCRPLMPCNLQSSLTPEFPNMCTNLRCGSSNSTCTNYANTCPPGNPVLCPNGACRRSAAECSWSKVGDAKCTDATKPVMCFDGFCRETALKCIETQFYATQGLTGWNPNGAVMNSTCRHDDVLCTSNGACQPPGTYCPPVPACPASAPMRCPDGSCKNTTLAGDCATAAACDTGLVRCEDGTCNTRENCATFDGCPTTSPYYCAGLANPCVADASACQSGYAANNNLPQACDTGCMRDLSVTGPIAYPVPQEGDLYIDIAMDANAAPRQTLTVPAGAVHVGAGLISVAPVPLAAFANIIVPLDENRAPEFGTDHFTSMTAIKSAPFTLIATGAEMDATYGAPGQYAHASQLGIAVTAFIDPLLYQVTTQQAAAAAAASAVQIPCAYQASFTVERVLFSTNSAGTEVAIACTGTSDVAQSAVTLAMDTCDGSSFTGFVVSVNEIEAYTSSHLSGSACVCYNLTRSTAPPPALNVQGYSVGQTVCTLYKREVDQITSATFVDPVSAMFACPTAVPAEDSHDATIRSLIYTAKATPTCQNAATGDAAKYIPANDICLARVRRPPMPQESRFSGYGDSWGCLYGRDDRLANPVWSTAATGQAATQYKATIPVSEVAVSGDYAYAFIHSPLPPPPPAEKDSQSAWEAYGKIILIVIICVGAFAIIASYVTWRLIRYRRKYKENQKKKIELTDRRNNLEEFSGGLGIADEEVDMVANPLVIELQNLEQQIKKVNEEMGVQEQRDAIAIQKLEEDRKKLYAEIDRVKQAMAKAEAEAEAAAKITAARETAAAQARANAANADAFGTTMGTSVRPSGMLGAADDGDNFAGAARPSQVQVAVDAGSGTTATTTAKGTTRLDFGQAKIRRPRDLSNS